MSKSLKRRTTANPLIGSMLADTLDNVSCSLQMIMELIPAKGKDEEIHLSIPATLGFVEMLRSILIAIDFERAEDTKRRAKESGKRLVQEMAT